MRPCFSNSTANKVFVWSCFLFSSLVGLFWAKQKFLLIAIDWSLALPVVSVFSALLPIVLSTKKWLEEKALQNEQRIDRVETEIALLKELVEQSKFQANELTKHLLRLESKIVSTKQMIENLKIEQRLNTNKRILRSIEKQSRSTNE